MTTYTAADLAAQLAQGAAVVFQWVGVAVAAAFLLFAVFLGIRMAVKFFLQIIGDGGGYDSDGNWSGADNSYDPMIAHYEAEYASHEFAATNVDGSEYDPFAIPDDGGFGYAGDGRKDF